MTSKFSHFISKVSAPQPWLWLAAVWLIAAAAGLGVLWTHDGSGTGATAPARGTQDTEPSPFAPYRRPERRGYRVQMTGDGRQVVSIAHAAPTES